MADGTPVFENSHIGGLAELMVTFEEWVVPIFTKAPAVDVEMVCSCVSVAGLGCDRLADADASSSRRDSCCGRLWPSRPERRTGRPHCRRVRPSSPSIRFAPAEKSRRESAPLTCSIRTSSATISFSRVRALTTWPTDRLWSGGRNPAGRRPGAGADFVIEAAGAAQVTPKLEAGPDPTGILPLQQAYQMCALGGHLVTTSLVRGNITLPGNLFSIGGVTHHAGQAGGACPMRDIPRFVALLEKGQFDAKSLATSVVPLERMLEAYEEVAYRTTVTAIMTA